MAFHRFPLTFGIPVKTLKTHLGRGLALGFQQVLAAVWFACLAATPLNAQVPEDVVRTETSLVQLNVGVVDKQGRAITSLSPNDFVVYEDGVRRPIVHFEPTNTPFSLVLLLDMSGSTASFR